MAIFCSVRESTNELAPNDHGFSNRVVRAHGSATDLLQIQTGQAEVVYTSVILGSVKIAWDGANFVEHRELDEPELDFIKESINNCLANHKPTSLAAAFRWLSRAQICKKRSQATV